MLPFQLKPKYEYELIRIGSNGDGGYLVEKQSLIKSKFLIGGGINDNWDFEKQFARPYVGIDDKLSLMYLFQRLIINTAKIFLFKNPKFFIKSIRNIFEYFILKKNFIKGYISDYENHDKNYITIKTIIDQYYNRIYSNSIFLKLDIEGSEYRILDDIIDLQDLFSGIIIEFHDIDLHQEKILKFVKNIDMHLVHIHPNNYGGVDKNNDPKVIEITFSKFPKIISERVILPNILDKPNDKKIQDLKLNFK